MRRLRAECPWKREQTHRSLARYLLEETHETLEAIDTGDETGDWDHLREELGDLLLQVYFHAVIAEESGAFTIDDVARGITEKMHRRNPHVFGPPSDDPPARRRRRQRGLAGDQGARQAARVAHRRPARHPPGAAVRRQGARARRAGDSSAAPARTTRRTADESASGCWPWSRRRSSEGVDPEQALRDAVRRLTD